MTTYICQRIYIYIYRLMPLDPSLRVSHALYDPSVRSQTVDFRNWLEKAS